MSGNRKRRPSLSAPADPMAGDELSPVPSATSTSVRPPAKIAVKAKPKSRLAQSVQMVAGVIVVLACSIAVAYGARRYVLSSPRFAVRTVLVDGAVKRTAQDIAQKGGVIVGANIFALDLEAAKDAIARDPWIASATVVRKLPSSVQINVIEREARAVVAIDSELFLATGDGELFKTIEADDPIDLPVITGIMPQMVVTDRPGVSIVVRRALDVATEIERAGLAKRYPIQELHLEKDGSLVVTVGTDAIALHLGHSPYRGKIEQARRVLAEIAARKANASVIFLDNDAHPERVVVRMR